MSRRAAGRLVCVGALAALAGACARGAAREVPAPVRAEAPPEAVPDSAAPEPVLPEPVPAPTPAEVPAEPPRHLLASVRLAFTGDINLGTSTLADGVPPDSGRGLFDAVREHLTGDLVVGNLEGVLADSGTSHKCRPAAPPRSPTRPTRPARPRSPNRGRRAQAARPAEPPPAPCYAFLTPTHLAPRLAEAGFTHLNLANNHAHDYGSAGRTSTEATIRRLGLEVYGPLGYIAIDTVRRGDSATTVALIGFATYPHSYDLLDLGRSAAVVDSVRRLADLVIVTFHGGAEGMAATRVPETAESLGREPRGELRRWARTVIDAGADLVIGHGPHVLRGMEFYRGKLVAYSLGNFLTYRGFNLRGPLGITGVLQVEFGADMRLRGARLVSMRQVALRGVVMDPARQAAGLVRRLSVEDFGVGAARVLGDGALVVP